MHFAYRRRQGHAAAASGRISGRVPGRTPVAFLGAGALLVFAGCASMSTEPPPAAQALPSIAVPVDWSAPAPVAAAAASAPTSGARTPTSLAQWWQRFDDPLLGELVQQALQANTDVQSATAAVRQARALRN